VKTQVSSGFYLYCNGNFEFHFFLINKLNKPVIQFKENQIKDLIKCQQGPEVNLITVKPAQAITSIKQSPVLKGHHNFVLS
jgi:hypothetical protein